VTGDFIGVAALIPDRLLASFPFSRRQIVFESILGWVRSAKSAWDQAFCFRIPIACKNRTGVLVQSGSPNQGSPLSPPALIGMWAIAVLKIVPQRRGSFE
jgi:hypothetical protein